MKKSFTLLEVLLSIFLLAILVITSLKAYTHLKQISQKDTMRYLALGKIDNEMNRLVFAFENYEMEDFRQYDYTFNNALLETFKILDKTLNPTGDPLTRYNVYKTNVLQTNYGLKIDKKLNIIELKNNDGAVNTVDEGDIVALLGFRSQDFTQGDSFSNISLSLTYPYIVRANGSNFTYEQLWDYVETVNLKTTTRRKN